MNSSLTVTRSQISITPSTVSQVGNRLKANVIKKKLRSLLKQVDFEKSGMVPFEVYNQLLELHEIRLDEKCRTELAKMARGDKLDWKKALASLTIDLEAAEEADAPLKWTLAKFAKAITTDSVNRVFKNS